MSCLPSRVITIVDTFSRGNSPGGLRGALAKVGCRALRQARVFAKHPRPSSEQVFFLYPCECWSKFHEQAVCWYVATAGFLCSALQYLHVPWHDGLPVGQICATQHRRYHHTRLVVSCERHLAIGYSYSYLKSLFVFLCCSPGCPSQS